MELKMGQEVVVAGREAQDLSPTGRDTLQAAVDALVTGDYDTSLEELALLKEEDIDPAMALLNSLIQTVMAVGTNHQLSKLIKAGNLIQEREQDVQRQRSSELTRTRVGHEAD
jgi:methanogenic corrinoid protein MtbC1